MANPATFRRDLQNQYDGYMGGERLSIRLVGHLSSIAADSIEERDEKIARLAERFPRATQALVSRAVHEAAFFTAGYINHRRGVMALFGEESELREHRALYVSGIGRNALGLTMSSDPCVTLLTPPDRAAAAMGEMGVDLLINDPDFGMGDFRRRGLASPSAAILRTPLNESSETGWITFADGPRIA